MALLITGLLLIAAGCRTRSAPSSRQATADLTPLACLEGLNLNKLEQSLDHCNQVVAAHRNDPAPLTDRSLLHTLLGQVDQACRDVDQALVLVKQQGKTADPMISHELNVRQDSCRQRRNSAGKG